MCISVGPPSRGAILQLTASLPKAATITYESWQLHLLEPFSFSTFQRPSLFAGMRTSGSVPQRDAGQLVSRGRDQIKAATLAKEFRLAAVEVARQCLNNYRLTHLQEAR
jgi:hypothetical protein